MPLALVSLWVRGQGMVLSIFLFSCEMDRIYFCINLMFLWGSSSRIYLLFYSLGKSFLAWYTVNYHSYDTIKLNHNIILTTRLYNPTAYRYRSSIYPRTSMSGDKASQNSPPHSPNDLLAPAVWAVRTRLKLAQSRLASGVVLCLLPCMCAGIMSKQDAMKSSRIGTPFLIEFICISLVVYRSRTSFWLSVVSVSSKNLSVSCPFSSFSQYQ